MAQLERIEQKEADAVEKERISVEAILKKNREVELILSEMLGLPSTTGRRGLSAVTIENFNARKIGADRLIAFVHARKLTTTMSVAAAGLS